MTFAAIKPFNTIVQSLAPGALLARREIAREVAARLNEALTSAPFRTIRATTKSQVFAVDSYEARYVVKLHALRENYQREKLAYMVLSGCGRVPKPVLYDDQRNSLILIRYEALTTPLRDARTLFECAETIGAIHGRAASVGSLLNLERIPRFDPMLATEEKWVRDKIAWTEYCAMENASVSPVCQDPCVGDIGIGHFLTDGTSVLLCDLETFTYGYSSVLDLALLHNACSDEMREASGWTDAVVSGYVNGRLNQQSGWSEDHKALRAKLHCLIEALA